MKNTFILLLSKVFEKGVMFLFFILLAKYFGSEVVGEFSYYYSIVVIIYVIFDMGGDFYQIRELSKNENIQKFNTIFILKSCIFILIFSFIYIINDNTYLLLFLITYYINSIISIFRSSLYIHKLYVLDSKYTIIEKSVFVVLIFINVISIKSLLFVYFTFLLSKLIYLFILLNKFYRFKYILNTRKLFNFNFAKEYLLNSWSYILHALLVVFFVQIDIIMLKQMGISYTDIGLYSVALKIYSISIIFADVLFKQYYPIVAKLIHTQENSKLKKFILKVQNVNIYFSIYFIIITVLFSKELVLIAFGDEFYESSKMLIFLSTIIVFRFSMYTYTAILSASELNYIKLYTSIICLLTNVILNYILIPIYGVYGAIIATIITEIVLVVLYKISSFKIIFTNYITVQEILAISSAILLSILFSRVDFSIMIKAIISLLIILHTTYNYKKIKRKLEFKKE